VDRATTSLATLAMSRKVNARIFKAAASNPVRVRASAASKEAVAVVAVVVDAGATVMTAEDRNPKVNRAAARFNRAP
jgi:hypothetical protein